MKPILLARTVVGAAIALMTFAAATAARASELVMFERDGCVYCQHWNRDVGALYGKTDEGKQLPLRRVDIQDQAKSGISLTSAVRFTPTFVIVDNGREIGRITGYFSDDMFWGLLDALVAKLPRSQANRI